MPYTMQPDWHSLPGLANPEWTERQRRAMIFGNVVGAVMAFTSRVDRPEGEQFADGFYLKCGDWFALVQEYFGYETWNPHTNQATRFDTYEEAFIIAERLRRDGTRIEIVEMGTGMGFTINDCVTCGHIFRVDELDEFSVCSGCRPEPEDEQVCNQGGEDYYRRTIGVGYHEGPGSER